MANMKNIAYPYTRAIFDMAKSASSVDAWLECLNFLSDFGKNLEFIDLISNPKISKENIMQVLVDSIDETSYATIKSEVIKFLQLLQENNRLLVLPDIADLFAELVAEDRKTCMAIIQTAFAMPDNVRQQLEDRLSEKFARKITATVEIRPELIGGIKIMINDTVIDSSIKGSLDNMAAQLIR